MSIKLLPPIYQIKINLNNAKPPIWRRVLVPSQINLATLHTLIQTVMGWQNCHLHQFIDGRIFYGVNDGFSDEMGYEDEHQYQLNQILKTVKDQFIYEYDFGDNWEHTILLEKILPHAKDKQQPRCITGRCACPPEDCGGIWGYQDLVDILNDLKHPEYADSLEWVGGEFDYKYFNIDDINARLAEQK